MKYRWSLARRHTLFEKVFRLDECLVRHELYAGGMSDEFTREIFERGAVVTVLPFDPRRREVVLIEQFRAGAIDDAESPWLIETVAGVVDPGETVEQVARREAIEEADCRLGRLLPIGRFYVSPGGSSELCSLFCGITDSSAIGGVHGLAHEHEDIRVFTVDCDEAFEWVRDGRVRSASTIIALQWLQQQLQQPGEGMLADLEGR